MNDVDCELIDVGSPGPRPRVYPGGWDGPRQPERIADRRCGRLLKVDALRSRPFATETPTASPGPRDCAT